MKKIILMSFLFLFSNAALAEYRTGPYIGAKYGKFYSDLDETDKPTGKGFLAGFNFGPGFAAELERTDTQFKVYDDRVQIGTIDMETQALYLVYRTRGQVYFKMKAGALKEELEAECRRCKNVKESDSGFSTGVGLGFNAAASHIQFEVEFTIIEADVAMLSAGANWRF